MTLRAGLCAFSNVALHASRQLFQAQLRQYSLISDAGTSCAHLAAHACLDRDAECKNRVFKCMALWLQALFTPSLSRKSILAPLRARIEVSAGGHACSEDDREIRDFRSMPS